LSFPPRFIFGLDFQIPSSPLIFYLIADNSFFLTLLELR
jgi:hypothetical protein